MQCQGMEGFLNDGLELNGSKDTIYIKNSNKVREVKRDQFHEIDLLIFESKRFEEISLL